MDYKRKYVTKQYKSASNLEKRSQIHKYNTNDTTWMRWLFGYFNLKENMDILEIGCGNGSLWLSNIDQIPKAVSLTLSDISEGMIQKAKVKLSNNIPSIDYLIFDAERIPFNENKFDIIIANHMLYHVENLEITLQEIRRTLKPDGTFFTSTIGKNHMKQLREFIIEFDLPYDFNPIRVASNFGCENGKEILKHYFNNINCIMYEDHLIIPDSEPILVYLSSLQNTEDQDKYKNIDKFKEFLANKIMINKVIKIEKETCLFKAWGADFL